MSDPVSFLQSLNGGAIAPAVNPEDLKRLWKFVESTRANLASRQGTNAAPPSNSTFGIQADLLAAQCSPGANTGAVMFRCSFLGMCAQQGLLAAWQHGKELDEFVFQVFADYPLHMGKFDLEALLQYLREQASK